MTLHGTAVALQEVHVVRRETLDCGISDIRNSRGGDRTEGHTPPPVDPGEKMIFSTFRIKNRSNNTGVMFYAYGLLQSRSI